MPMNNNPAHEIKAPLIALLVAADRALARAFLDALATTQAFQIAAEIKSYPNRRTLEMRLEQVRPDVVLVDLAADLETACEVIRGTLSLLPSCRVIGIHAENKSEAILKSVRAGATEFLHAPFETSCQIEAAARVRKLLSSAASAQPAGRLLAFTSAKEGSGASTLARQVALAVRSAVRQRVLLADLDFNGGTLAFSLNLASGHHGADAGRRATAWDLPSPVSGPEGSAVLPAPMSPLRQLPEPDRVGAFLDSARQSFDWVLADLPPVFERLSLFVMSQADRVYLLATPELPSLHLTRKALTALQQLGFPSERVRIVLNRVDRRGETALASVERLFPASLEARLPDDSFAIQTAMLDGAPVGAATEYGKAVAALAASLAGDKRRDKSEAPAATR
jgi:pilus assembly protein CpaE